jgi:hypothetical protein
VPDANYLIAIAEVGVEIFYVLFGERKMINPDQYLNTTLLGEIIDAVDTWAAQRQSPIASQTKSELITLFYKQFQDRSVDIELMTRHLKLVG